MKLLVKRKKAEETARREKIWQDEQDVLSAAAALAARKVARGKAKEQRRREKIEKFYQSHATQRLQLRTVLLPSIVKTSSPSTSSPTRLVCTTDGGWYTGETDNGGVRNGYGCRYYRDGALLYRGYYKRARFHGYGERYAQDGRVMYRGNYVEDEASGQGRGWSLSGESFDGEWIRGLPLGDGRLYDSNGKSEYFGRVKNWKPHGEGKVLSPYDETVLYEGTMSNGIRHGFGTGVWPKPLPRGRSGTSEISAENKTLEGNDEEEESDDEEEDKEEEKKNEEEKKKNEEEEENERVSENNDSPKQLDTLRFRGQWMNGIPQGKGVLLDKDNRVRHEGVWLDGVMHGKGVHTYVDGSVFRGEWVHGKKTGAGEWIGHDGSRLECTWSEGHRCGRGKWSGPVDSGTAEYVDPIKARSKGSRASHVGSWSNGAMEGLGEWWGSDGSHYKGSFHKNERHGRGKLTNADKTFIVGRWKDGKLHGDGELFLKEIAAFPVYTGTFHEGAFHGKGTYLYLDGTQYEGEWKDGERHGRGEFRLKNGTVAYDGHWANDKQSGFGLTQILGGLFQNCVYRGCFTDGQREGPDGELSTAEGRLLYRGGWRSDQFDGHGEWWPMEGNETYVGSFKNGARHGHGTMKMEDGRVYVGEWEMGEMHGSGKLSGLPGNDVQEGLFRGNHFVESPWDYKARLGYEKLMEEIYVELVNEGKDEYVVWDRQEKQRLKKLEWELLDPEYETQKKIEAMRQEKLKRLEELRLKKEREEKMKGAMLARRKRERLQKDRRDRHNNRINYAELRNMMK